MNSILVSLPTLMTRYGMLQSPNGGDRPVGVFGPIINLPNSANTVDPLAECRLNAGIASRLDHPGGGFTTK